MLEHSRGMNIRPDEWLTVAAHRGESPLGPNEIINSSTLVLRIKGSDLALYDADRTRKAEIRQRVEAREFDLQSPDVCTVFGRGVAAGRGAGCRLQPLR